MRPKRILGVLLASLSLIAALSLSSVATAGISQESSQQAIRKSENSLLLPAAKTEQKYCRVVRNSLYAKFRRKCRTVAEWKVWVAEVPPKIEKQWKMAGATSPAKSKGMDLSSRLHYSIPYDYR